MHHTFELYVRHPGGHRQFVALTCPPGEVMGRARQVLRELDGVELEVHQAGEHLFTLAAEGP